MLIEYAIPHNPNHSNHKFRLIERGKSISEINKTKQ